MRSSSPSSLKKFEIRIPKSEIKLKRHIRIIEIRNARWQTHVVPRFAFPISNFSWSFRLASKFVFLIMRILVVEDEKKTAAFLAKGLREAGFAVDVAADGETGLEQARAKKFDLLIVDIMLPHKDGWELVAELRRDRVRTPILFLTARDSVRDRVKGLELGADDYLVKPFAFAELLARVRSVLRRAPQRQAEHLRIDGLEIDMRRHKATRSGVPLNLTPKEFLLLAHLVRSAGEVVSRAEIAEHVWDIGFKTDTNVVDVVVRRLRAKVDDPFKTKLIHTIRGVGYVLRAQ
jgi:two-component system copper resistance phosphate regulon response regulator CusR